MVKKIKNNKSSIKVKIISFFSFFCLSISLGYFLLYIYLLNMGEDKVATLIVATLINNAFEYKIYAKDCDNYDDLNMVIDSGYFSCFKKYHKKNNDKNIILNNFGGYVIESYFSAKYVQDNNIGIKVSRFCFSACAQILFASKNAIVCDNAIIGIHSPKVRGRLYSNMVKVLSKSVFEKNGRDFNYDFFQNKIDNTPSSEMYYLSASELLENGMVSEVVECDS